MTTNVLTLQDTLYSRRWLVITTIMMVAVLEVLDSTIVNVALPAMMPSLGANQNQITWIITSYVVASAIILPLTGFLSNRLGQKNLLLLCITGFMFSSLICGLAQSLPDMILFRILQGFFGASLIPLSQAILRETFPLEEQGKAMAIWGIGIMAAPVFGPTLGGFITEHGSWRWIFYINLPVCLLGLALTLWVIPAAKRHYQSIDWLGLLFMVIGVGALQLFLDKGNENDWLSSNLILILMIVSILCLTFFILRSLLHRHPVIKLAIYRDRNFSICCLILFLYCGIIFGLITLEPILLERLYNYPAMTAGWTMAPLGIASGVAMMFVSGLMKRVPIKMILLSGVLFGAYGAFRFSHITLATNMHEFLLDNSFLGFGMGIFMVPLATYSLATVAQADITEGSGLFSYARMIGTSVGVSLLSTLISRTSQMNWHTLSGHATVFNDDLHLWFAHQHLPFLNSVGVFRLATEIQQQASFLSFLDGFKVISLVFLALIPLIFMLKTVELRSDAGSTPH